MNNYSLSSLQKNSQFKIFLTLLLMIIASLPVRAHDHGNFYGSEMLAGMAAGDKAALLMVHFGTTHSDTREATIEAINRKARDTFGELEFREAWTSRIVLRRMKERGIEMPTPAEALKQLKADGFTHVIIQSSNIIEGIEMEALRKEVAAIEKEFKDIRIGNPLLYTPGDYEEVIAILTTGKPAHDDVVLVGHGTYTAATSQYAMMDYMLKVSGHTHYHVGTVEGYPEINDVKEQLKKTKAKEVTLVPFMFVAGEHAKNDIAGDWKEELEEEGLRVHVCMQGLGEIAGIQDLFIEHIRFILHHKMYDILEKKSSYAAGKDRH